MRSLFVKIFLWFWITQVLVALVLVFTWTLQPDVLLSRWRANMDEALTLYAKASADELDKRGPASLTDYFARLHANSGVQAGLLGEHGTPIAGFMSEPLRMLGIMSLRTGQPELVLHGGVALVAQRITGPSGRTYVFVAEMESGPLGVFKHHATRIAVRFGLSILVSGLICYALARYLTRPILRLRTASRELASGDLSARAGPRLDTRRDELGDLVRDFNLMADRIEALLTSQRQLISDISH